MPGRRQSLKSLHSKIPLKAKDAWFSVMASMNGRRDARKTPFRITRRDGSAFAMAGIWDKWIDHKGEELRSFAILTTHPNSLMEKIHDRMPVILDRVTEKRWIEAPSQEELIEMLKPLESSALIAYPVSTLVNSPRYDSPEIMKPAGEPLS